MAQIKSLLPTDIDSINWCHPMHLKAMQSAIYNGGTHYVILKDQTIVSKACMQWRDNFGFISMVATHPDHLRQGYCTKLVNHLIDLSKGKHLVLKVETHNESAIVLYEKLGFKRVGLTTDGWEEENGWYEAKCYQMELAKRNIKQ